MVGVDDGAVGRVLSWAVKPAHGYSPGREPIHRPSLCSEGVVASHRRGLMQTSSVFKVVTT